MHSIIMELTGDVTCEYWVPRSSGYCHIKVKQKFDPSFFLFPLTSFLSFKGRIKHDTGAVAALLYFHSSTKEDKSAYGHICGNRVEISKWPFPILRSWLTSEDIWGHAVKVCCGHRSPVQPTGIDTRWCSPHFLKKLTWWGCEAN